MRQGGCEQGRAGQDRAGQGRAGCTLDQQLAYTTGIVALDLFCSTLPVSG